MSIRNSSDSYGSITKFFHWGIVLAVYSMLAIGYIQGNLKNEAFADQVYNFHKLLGLTILCFMVFRLSWRMSNPRPGLPNTIPKWQMLLARVSHLFLYVTLFTMPTSGWIMSSAS